MMRRIFQKIYSLPCALMALACLHSPALAAPDEDLQTLEMFYEGKDLVVSATRNPKPISQTAENVTIITAADIETMGAHTLPDVLNNVLGLQTDSEQSVGTVRHISIQGATPNHLLVLLDGVTLNYYLSSFSDLGGIPVQNIERIEIVKGPGSSSWGSALGGVINIVTKSPVEERKFDGTLSSSIGEKLTRDNRGEVSGTMGRLGYYLYAGNLASDGLRPHTRVDENNLYTKLRWELPRRGSLLFTLGYNQGSRQDGEGEINAEDVYLKDPYHYFLSTLSMTYPLGDHADLDLSLRGSTKSSDNILIALSTGDLFVDAKTRESTYGGSAKLSWRNGFQRVAVGADFDHVDAEGDTHIPIMGLFSQLSLNSDKFGLFLSDTLTFKDLAITPGIRYDRMNPVGEFFSPSLGIAWRLNDHTTLRAYGAKGYSLPLMVPGQGQEKVLTCQAGFETTRIPFLWLKTTFYRNQLSDVQGIDFTTGAITLVKHLKQGVEVEARTVPLFNTSFSGGYTFIDATDRDSGEILPGIPRQIVKLGLHYDDRRSLRGALLGRYVWWSASTGNNAKGNTGIWDVNLAKKIFTRRDMAVELFFSAHNIFDSQQFSDEFFKNARRWVEGGIRFDF